MKASTKSVQELVRTSPLTSSAPTTSTEITSLGTKNWGLWSAIGGVAVIGVATIGYIYKQRRAEKRKEEKILQSKKRKQKRNLPVVLGHDGLPLTEEELIEPSFLRKQPRRVLMYFDKNDEMVPEFYANSDPKNYYHKYHVVDFDF